MDIWRGFPEKPILTQNYKICGKHFHSGRPANLYEGNDLNWLPSLHLGHKKGAVPSGSGENVARCQRLKNRERKKAMYESLVEQVPVLVTNLIEMMAAKKCQLICAEQIKIASEYVSTTGVVRPAEKTVCECFKKVKELQEELTESKELIDGLNAQLEQHLPPFCEQSFVSNDFTQTHTGLPNLKIVSAVFQHVSKTLPSERETKLTKLNLYVC